jgi:hypothetical protein
MNALYVLAVLAAVPSTAFAQAAITGSVRDGSGAGLPGVMVQAASPALIGKLRLAVTDGAGQYRIEHLGPGTYTISFTLKGWKALALDTYNALNSSAVLAYNPAFVPGGTWLQPVAIMTPRLIKVTGEVDF